MSIKYYNILLGITLLLLTGLGAVVGAFVMQSYMYDHQGFQDVVTTYRVTGDVNSDGVVNQKDIDVIKQNWNMANATWSDGDLNGDGKVTAIDLSIVSANWMNGAGEKHFLTV